MHTSTETQATVMTPISKQRNLTSKRRKVKSPRVFTTRTVPDSQEKTADRSPTGDVMTGNAPVPSSVSSCTFNSDPPPPSPPLPAASPWWKQHLKYLARSEVRRRAPEYNIRRWSGLRSTRVPRSTRALSAPKPPPHRRSPSAFIINDIMRK
ncbi:unnamed protein product [Arctia plantaginis]|uniref:Uncharacterized protein n=1 Tax=Arctia plantaginis TaxID=874455 RepID=A0A8S0Z068_ARCPL|nr:unnamed protein product [Arctia plantaginis]